MNCRGGIVDIGNKRSGTGIRGGRVETAPAGWNEAEIEGRKGKREGRKKAVIKDGGITPGNS